MASEVVLQLDASHVNYTIRTVLDDVTYCIDVRWNDAEQVWYLDLLDETRDPIVVGVALLLGCAVGWRCQDARMPKGILMLVDLSKQQQDATRNDLGSRVAVYYFPPGSVT